MHFDYLLTLFAVNLCSFNGPKDSFAENPQHEKLHNPHVPHPDDHGMF